MATTQVILRTKIENLGAEADIVTVKAGFARNYLVPQGKAYEANDENRKNLEDLQKARVQREAEELQNAEKLSAKIKKLKHTFTLETGQGGKAFGSVTSIDLHKKLESSNVKIDRKAIQLNKPIKGTGKQSVEIKLHADVSVNYNFTVDAAEAEGTEDAAE